MTQTPEPIPQTATHRLHEARRAEVRARFFDRVADDSDLALSHVQGRQLADWHHICDRIFDVVFDRNDFFEQIKPDEGQLRTDAILRDMRDVGLGGVRAFAQYKRIALHAVEATTHVHADPNQRNKLHRAQQPDANGRWRNPNGKFAIHYEPGFTQTVEEIMENAQGHAVGSKMLRMRFESMLQLMDEQLHEDFWSDEITLRELTEYGKKVDGYPRHAVTQAVRLDLLGKYPQLPTPAIGTSKPRAPKPDRILSDVTDKGLYSIALCNTLYQMAHASIKGAYMEELRPHRDLTLLTREQADALQDKVELRVAPMISLYHRIAETALPLSDLRRYETGIEMSFDAIEKGFQQHMDAVKEKGNGGPAL